MRAELRKPPLIAILRGITPAEAVPVAKELHRAGISMVEVTMNSPDPLESIGRISAEVGENMLVGAGTVLTTAEVQSAADAGSRLIVSPNFNPAVVARTKELGMISVPGIMTPTEAFAALEAGADWLKLFPGEIVSPQAVRALRAVISAEVPLIVTGGVNSSNGKEYLSSGVDGLGLGSAVYRKKKSPMLVGRDALNIIAALESACGGS